MLTAAEARKLKPQEPVTLAELEVAIRHSAEASGMRIVGSGDFKFRPILSDAVTALEAAGFRIEVKSASNWSIRW